jgi:glucokinase
MTDTTEQSPLVVTADIGGTNTRVALARGSALLADTVRRYRNADHDGFDPILRDFIAQSAPVSAQPQGICVDIAGPVQGRIGRLTNRGWQVDADEIGAMIGAQTAIVINDMQAQGFALAHLPDHAVMPLVPGPTAPAGATRLVVNVGTGLNAAPVYQIAGRSHVPPTEAGHITLSVQSPTELRLFDHIAAQHGTPGLEDVLSGRGFERIHAFLCAEAGPTHSPLPAPALMAALQAGDPLAQQAGRLFTRFMGRFAGDLALSTLPFGGVYLVGGVVNHFAPHLADLGFAQAFADKGRFSNYMAQFPVHVVRDDHAALIGGAAHLTEVMQPERASHAPDA